MPLSSGFGSKIGAIGFEPTTSSTPSWRAKPLRHAPISHYSEGYTGVKHDIDEETEIRNNFEILILNNQNSREIRALNLFRI
jgi:hypothetical protein